VRVGSRDARQVGGRRFDPGVDEAVPTQRHPLVPRLVGQRVTLRPGTRPTSQRLHDIPPEPAVSRLWGEPDSHEDMSANMRREGYAVLLVVEIELTHVLMQLGEWDMGAQAARFRARLDGIGDASSVEPAFIEPEETFVRIGMPFWVAVTQYEHAERLTANGRHAEGGPMLASPGVHARG
jgi:hypothetical protein